MEENHDELALEFLASLIDSDVIDHLRPLGPAESDNGAPRVELGGKAFVLNRWIEANGEPFVLNYRLADHLSKMAVLLLTRIDDPEGLLGFLDKEIPVLAKYRSEVSRILESHPDIEEVENW